MKQDCKYNICLNNQRYLMEFYAVENMLFQLSVHDIEGTVFKKKPLMKKPNKGSEDTMRNDV